MQPKPRHPKNTYHLKKLMWLLIFFTLVCFYCYQIRILSFKTKYLVMKWNCSRQIVPHHRGVAEGFKNLSLSKLRPEALVSILRGLHLKRLFVQVFKYKSNIIHASQMFFCGGNRTFGCLNHALLMKKFDYL